jgi:hypothetical protein
VTPLGVAAGAASDVAGAAVDAAGGVALDVAKAIVGVAADAIGESGVRVALWVALVGAGVIGMGFGFARVTGLGEKAQTAAGLGGKIAAIGAAV